MRQRRCWLPLWIAAPETSHLARHRAAQRDAGKPSGLALLAGEVALREGSSQLAFRSFETSPREMGPWYQSCACARFPRAPSPNPSNGSRESQKPTAGQAVCWGTAPANLVIIHRLVAVESVDSTCVLVAHPRINRHPDVRTRGGRSAGEAKGTLCKMNRRLILKVSASSPLVRLKPCGRISKRSIYRAAAARNDLRRPKGKLRQGQTLNRATAPFAPR